MQTSREKHRYTFALVAGAILIAVAGITRAGGPVDQVIAKIPIAKATKQDGPKAASGLDDSVHAAAADPIDVNIGTEPDPLDSDPLAGSEGREVPDAPNDTTIDPSGRQTNKEVTASRNEPAIEGSADFVE